MGSRIKTGRRFSAIYNIHIGSIKCLGEIKGFPKNFDILTRAQKSGVDVLGARAACVKIDSSIGKRYQNIDYERAIASVGPATLLAGKQRLRLP